MAEVVEALAQLVELASRAAEVVDLQLHGIDPIGDARRLVESAGKTMEDIVGAVKRVTDIMGEISAASQEQSQGVAQVGDAVTQMDQVTQQNAALVEEMAAAASSLKNQANDLVQAVSVFKLSAETRPSKTLALH